MNKNYTTLGALKRVKIHNGATLPAIKTDDIKKFVDFARAENLVFCGNKEQDDSNKKNLYQLYAYNGTKGTFANSNICFVDIDSREGVDEILKDCDKLFKAVDECANINFIQKSYSGKLHICCNIPECSTIEQWQAEAVFTNLLVLQELKRLYGFDYMAGGWDTNELKFTQALAVSAHDVIFNPWSEEKYFIPFKYRKNQFKEYRSILNKIQHKTDTAAAGEIVKGSGIGFYNIGYRGEKIRIDKNFSVGSWNGTNLRWRVVNAAFEIFGDDYTQFIKDYFVNSAEILTNKPKFKACQRVKNWLIRTFDITPKKPILHRGEYLTKYEKEVRAYIQANSRAGIIAPTGAGKTTLIKKIAKDFNAVIICPYNSIISQYEDFTNLNTLRKRDTPDVNTLYVGTFDQALKHDFSERLVIIDESHTLFTDGTYRDRLCYLLNNYQQNQQQKLLCVSATPCKEFDLLGIKTPMQFERDRKHIATFWEVIDGDTTIKETEIINTFIRGGAGADFDKIIIFDDFSAKKLYPMYKSQASLLASDCKFDDDFIFTIEKQQLSKRVTFSTKICFNGVNFNDKGNILAICRFTPGITTEQFITQAVGRFRNPNANITLLILESKIKRTTPIATKIERAQKVNKISSEYGDFAELIQKGIADERFNDEIIQRTNLQIEEYLQANATREKIIEGLQKRGYFDIKKQYTDTNSDKFKDINKTAVSNSFKKQLSEGVAPECLIYDKTLLYAREWQRALVDLTKIHADGTIHYTKNYIMNYVATAMEKTTINTIIRGLRLMLITKTWTKKEFDKLADIYAKILLLYPDTPDNKTARQIIKGNFHRYKKAYEDSHKGEQMELFNERMEKCQHHRRANCHKLKIVSVSNGQVFVFASKNELRKHLVNNGYTETQTRFLINNKKDENYYISILTKADEKQIQTQNNYGNGTINRNTRAQASETARRSNCRENEKRAGGIFRHASNKDFGARYLRNEAEPGTAETAAQNRFASTPGGRDGTNTADLRQRI